MKKITITRKAIYALFALLFAWNSYCQLPAFTITATPTPQTCTGNGAISFTTTGTQPGATLSYQLFLLPNTTTPLTIVSASPINSLSAGTYLLRATQSLGAESNTSEATVTIANQVLQLTYNLVQTKVRCGNDGAITVNVTEGTAVSYEIIAGPVLKPLQSSNIFNNLPIGPYQVRVHDNCGDALVVSIQVTAASPLIIIDPVDLPGGPLPTCNTILVENFFATSTANEIFFPLTLEYTVFPPGGGTPVVVTGAIAAGTNNLNTAVAAIPFYNGQAYTYNLKITDACGNVYTRNNNAINASFGILATPNMVGCSDNIFAIEPGNYVAPYTIVFTNAPAGFTPMAYNPQHPNIFTEEAVYGSEGNSVPEGSYTVQVTDACGRIATQSFVVADTPVTPNVVAQSEGCAGEGTVTISFNTRTIVIISITAAPPSFGQALPLNVSANIGPLGFEMEDLPLGEYTFVLLDNCGETHTVEAEIEPGEGNIELNVLQRPGCVPGEGSVRIRNVDGTLSQVIITGAPAGFNQTLPYNVTANIAANGMFFMNSLPQGDYTVSVQDACGVPGTGTFSVTGYQVTTNNVEILPACGNFSINLAHVSNGNYIPSYWLQAQDPDTGVWQHPGTGVDYTEGTMPTAANSKPIVLGMNLDNQHTGTFRILKVFHVYSNGSATNDRCFSVIHNFEFSGRPVIHEAYGFPCANGLSEVALDATGVAPLTYQITTKNGAPFTIDNGTSNIFSGLESATYNFRVIDNCGSFANIEFNINELDPIEITADNLCEGETGLLSVPEFSFLSYEWYDVTAPTTILSSTNSLSLAPFDSAIHAGTYAVRIYSSNPSSCIDNTIEIVVAPNTIPNAGTDETVIVCNTGGEIQLESYLAAGSDLGGTWADVNASGALTDNMLNTAGLVQGTYQFSYTVGGDCGLVDDSVITIDLRDTPSAPVASPVPGICEGGDIQLSVATVADAVYEWTGPDNFTSSLQNPLITGAGMIAAGDYSVKVIVNGCTSPETFVNVAVNDIPEFTVSGNTVVCEGQTTQLTIVPGNFVPGPETVYEWYYEGVLQTADGDSVIISETGNYEVRVINGICQGVPQSVTITENTDAFDVLVEDGCRDFDYFISVINIQDLEGATFEWTGPGSFMAIGPEIKITDMPSGTYKVTVTNVDGCSTVVEVPVDNTMCRIPRGISPGDAENNNEFDLSNLEVSNLTIFNRYGLEVYSKENYEAQWHGQSKSGADLPTGTYYYVISLASGKQVTGWVYLQRQN